MVCDETDEMVDGGVVAGAFEAKFGVVLLLLLRLPLLLDAPFSSGSAGGVSGVYQPPCGGCVPAGAIDGEIC